MRALLAALALLAAGLAAAPAAHATVGCDVDSSPECQAYTGTCNVDAEAELRFRTAAAVANCGHGMYRCQVEADVRSALLQPRVDHGCAV